MDNTELHYVTYDPEEIWTEMMTNYVAAGGDILYPGDEKEMLLRSVQADIVQAFAGMDNALRMATLRYAVGSYLDAIGELRGCSRIEAQAATSKVLITTAATGEETVLAAGTELTGDGMLFFLIDEDITLSGYQQEIEVDITCAQEGSIGNALAAGTSLSFAARTGIENMVTSIVTTEDARGGNDEEDDDTYRERIREYGLATVTTGPSQKYEAAAKEVSSEILDARADNLDAGLVGVYLILKSETGKEAIIQAVLDALSEDSVRPLTDRVVVYEAHVSTYSVSYTCTYDGTTQTRNKIEDAIAEYQDWQDNHLGRELSLNRLVAFMYQAGCTNVRQTNMELTDFEVAGTELEGLSTADVREGIRWKGTINITYVTE